MHNRKLAALAGETTYKGERPCRAGHDSPRYVSTGQCVECLRAHNRTYSDALREARKPVADRATLFTYRLAVEDHAAALAFCQALDLQRGRTPAATETVGAKAEPPRFATPEEVAVHRARILADLGATQRTQAEQGMSEAMAEQLRAYGMLK